MRMIMFLLTMLTAWQLAAASRTILSQEFNGPALSDVKSADGWMLQRFWAGRLARKNGALELLSTQTGKRNWGRMMCPLLRHNASGMRLDLVCRVRGTGRFRAGAVRYYPDRPVPQPKDYIWSGWEPLTAEWRDFSMKMDLSGELLRGLNFVLELDGDGRLELDAFRVAGEYDETVRIDAPAPILVRAGDPVPPPCFRTNRPGGKFIVFSASSVDAVAIPDMPAGVVTADAEGRAVVPAAMIDASRPIQVFRLSLQGNGLVKPPASFGCAICGAILSQDRTTGSVVITRIPSDEYDTSLQAAKKAKLNGAKTVLILADSIWDFDRGANAADRMNFFLRKAQGGNIKVVNYAVHGDRIDKMTARFKGDLAAVDHGKARYRDLKNETPDLIMIMLGHNDTATNSRSDFASPTVDPEVQKAKYGELLAALKETYPRSKVILLTPLAVNYEGILKRCEEMRKAGRKLIFRYGDPDKVGAFRKTLAEVAGEHKLPLLDMYTPTEHLDNKPSYFRPDNVHLSPRGYGLLARLVLREMGK